MGHSAAAFSREEPWSAGEMSDRFGQLVSVLRGSGIKKDYLFDAKDGELVLHSLPPTGAAEDASPSTMIRLSVPTAVRHVVSF